MLLMRMLSRTKYTSFFPLRARLASRTGFIRLIGYSRITLFIDYIIGFNFMFGLTDCNLMI